MLRFLGNSKEKMSREKTGGTQASKEVKKNNLSKEVDRDLKEALPIEDKSSNPAKDKRRKNSKEQCGVEKQSAPGMDVRTAGTPQEARTPILRTAGSADGLTAAQRNEQNKRRLAEAKVHALCNTIITKTLEFKGPPDPNAEHCIYELTELRELCIRTRELFLSEPSFQKISPPLHIFGDLHGQLTDLLAMFKIMGEPPKQRMLFLGDYVDRGPNSIEVIALLMAYKLRFPQHIYLLRGNHETRFINRQYGFFDECQRKFGIKGMELWTQFQHAFNCLPVAALVGGRIYCAHGGISEDLLTFSQFSRIRRPTDITDLGVLTDVLWSDPTPKHDRYGPSPRGVSALFGKKAVEEFCQMHDIDLIVRAHQCIMDGYEFFADKKCLTIFSAPYYCGEIANAAGILYVNRNMQCQILTYRVNTNQANTNSCMAAPADTPGGVNEKEKDKEHKKDAEKKSEELVTNQTPITSS